jgi:hypothetical protein
VCEAVLSVSLVGGIRQIAATWWSWRAAGTRYPLAAVVVAHSGQFTNLIYLQIFRIMYLQLEKYISFSSAFSVHDQQC